MLSRQLIHRACVRVNNAPEFGAVRLGWPVPAGQDVSRRGGGVRRNCRNGAAGASGEPPRQKNRQRGAGSTPRGHPTKHCCEGSPVTPATVVSVSLVCLVRAARRIGCSSFAAASFYAIRRRVSAETRGATVQVFIPRVNRRHGRPPMGARTERAPRSQVATHLCVENEALCYTVYQASRTGVATCTS